MPSSLGSSIPKVTLSVASEVIEKLKRIAKDKEPTEVMKEIIIKYVDKAAKLAQRVTTLKSYLDNLNLCQEELLTRLSTKDIIGALRQVHITIRWLHTLLLDFSQLPLSEGERRYLDKLKAIIEFHLKEFDELKQRNYAADMWNMQYYLLTSIYLLFCVKSWLDSILADAGTELKELLTMSYEDVLRLYKALRDSK